MKYMTRNGICVNLEYSPYIFVHKDLELRFSSQLYLNKYREKISPRIKEDKYLFSSRYYSNMDVTVWSYFDLYQKIEKRGFYAIYKGKVIKCPDNLQYEFQIKIDNSLIKLTNQPEPKKED